MHASEEFRGACPDSAVAMRRSWGICMSAFRVLFLCTGNTARSQIAETLLDRRAQGRFEVESAGTAPAQGEPRHRRSARAAGFCWTGGDPEWRVDRQRWDFVVTVCDDAKEACPIFPAGPSWRIGAWPTRRQWKGRGSPRGVRGYL